jgi:hypothetical protein
MHLFDTTDSGVVARRRKFYIAITVLPLETYAVAGLAYWLVKSKQDGLNGKATKRTKEGHFWHFKDTNRYY